LPGQQESVDWSDRQEEKSVTGTTGRRRMSASVSSHTSFNSRRSAGNSRCDGRSNYRSNRANSHHEFNGIKFVFVGEIYWWMLQQISLLEIMVVLLLLLVATACSKS